MDFLFTRILTKPFLVTVFRYMLAAAGTWLASNYGFDPSQWEVIAGALLTIAVTVMGGADSVREKVNVSGKSVGLEQLSPSAQLEARSAADYGQKRSLLDILTGK